MKKSATPEVICRDCGATIATDTKHCQTCSILDKLSIALETGELASFYAKLGENGLELLTRSIVRFRDRYRVVRKSKLRRKIQDFDFALQELEKTARGLELTNIEAVGVLEMVKQGFIEEVFYEDYQSDEDDDDDDGD